MPCPSRTLWSERAGAAAQGLILVAKSFSGPCLRVKVGASWAWLRVQAAVANTIRGCNDTRERGEDMVKQMSRWQ